MQKSIESNDIPNKDNPLCLEYYDQRELECTQKSGQ